MLHHLHSETDFSRRKSLSREDCRGPLIGRRIGKSDYERLADRAGVTGGWHRRLALEAGNGAAGG